MKKRELLKMAAMAAVSVPVVVQSQSTWPARPIKFVVPYPPGGPIDGMMRLIMTKVSTELGQPIVIDNRAGAGGAVGTASVVQGESTGYLFGTGVAGVLSIIPSLSKTPFTANTVEYVTQISRSPHVLLVNADSPIDSLARLVELARKEPGKYNYGSTGTGGSTHLVGELLAQRANINIVHIPYKGGAQLVNAILSKEVDFVPIEVSAGLQMLDRFKIIAVLSEKRVPVLANVPTAAEQGYPQLVSSAVYGVIAPSGTPAPIIERFRVALTNAANQPDVKEKLAQQGQIVLTNTPREYKASTVADSERWKVLIAQRKISLN